MARPKGSKNRLKEAQMEPDQDEETNTAVEAQADPAPRNRKARTETPLQRKITNGPTPTQLQEWLTEMTELDTASSRVRQKQSALKKNVESGSGNWKALKALFASSKLSEPEAQAHLEAVVGYHRSLGIKVSFDPTGQGTFDDIVGPAATPTEIKEFQAALDRRVAARSHADGYNSGLAGAVPSDNPFAAGTEEFVQWLKGREDGQLDRELKTPGMADRIEASRQADGTIPSETPSMPVEPTPGDAIH